MGSGHSNNPLQQRIAARPRLTQEQGTSGIYHGEVSGAQAMGFSDTGSMAGVSRSSQRIPIMVPQEQSWRSYGALAPEQKQLLGSIMDAKRGKGNWGQQELEGVWASGVQGSGFMGAWSGTPITPLEWLQDQYLNGGAITGSGGSGSGGGGGGGGGGGPTSVQSTSVSIQLTNEDTAAKVVDDALSTYLGREANTRERSAFVKALNRYESKNPTISQSTTVSQSAGGATSTQSTSQTRGGTDPAQFAKTWAQAKEGSSEHAAAGLLDSFMQALENPMDVVS